MPFNDEELSIIKTYLKPKKLRKKQYLLQEADVCKFIAFVEKGALRFYSIDDKGSERIIQFALQEWTISDLYSFLTGETRTYAIDALEDSELVLINKTSQEELCKTLLKYETWIRIQITGPPDISTGLHTNATPETVFITQFAVLLLQKKKAVKYLTGFCNLPGIQVLY